MTTSDSITPPRRWQFGLRDLLAAFVWASLVLYALGWLLAKSQAWWVAAFLAGPAVLFAFVMLTTRHRTWPEGALGVLFALLCYLWFYANQFGSMPAGDVVPTAMLAGGVGGATAATLGALNRGYSLVGTIAFLPMSLWWLMAIYPFSLA